MRPRPRTSSLRMRWHKPCIRHGAWTWGLGGHGQWSNPGHAAQGRVKAEGRGTAEVNATPRAPLHFSSSDPTLVPNDDEDVCACGLPLWCAALSSSSPMLAPYARGLFSNPPSLCVRDVRECIRKYSGPCGWTDGARYARSAARAARVERKNKRVAHAAALLSYACALY